MSKQQNKTPDQLRRSINLNLNEEQFDALAQLLDSAAAVCDQLDPLAFNDDGDPETGSPAHEVYVASLCAHKAVSKLLEGVF